MSHVLGNFLSKLSLEERLDALVAAEFVICEVAKVDLVAQIARAEVLLREYLLSKWDQLSREAVDAGSKAARQGASGAEIARKVNVIMGRWGGEVKARYADGLERIYRLAREVGWKKCQGLKQGPLTYDTPTTSEAVGKAEGARRFAEAKPAFDVIDERAVESLVDHQVFWTGAHYEKNVSDAIARTAKEAIVESGGDPVDAGTRVRAALDLELGRASTPAGYRGSAEQYFEGLVANAATVARTQGQLRSFVDYGITKYTIMNPLDERTCEICGAMDGKTFTTTQGVGVMAGELGSDPGAVQEAHPWLTSEKLEEMGIKRGEGSMEDSAALAEGGFAMPPFHFRCRCTIDVSQEAGSWDPAEGELPQGEDVLPPELQPEEPPPPPVIAEGVVPPEFPELAKSPVTPTTYFNETKFKDAFRKLKIPTAMKGNNSLVREEFAIEIRREMNALVAAEKLVNTDIGKHGRTLLAMARGGGGFHTNYSGRIAMGKDCFKSLKGMSKKGVKLDRTAAKKLTRDEAWSMKVLLHETIHGCTSDKFAAYHGVTPGAATSRIGKVIGRVIEESTTEVVTKFIANKKWGLQWFAPGEASCAYDPGIERLTELTHAVAKKLTPSSNLWSKFSGNAAQNEARGIAHLPMNNGGRKLLTDAALRFKSDPDRTETAKEFLEAFVSKFKMPPELTAGLKTAEIDALNTAFQNGMRKSLLEDKELTERFWDIFNK